MPQPEKVQKVKALTEQLSSAKSIFLTDYSGLSVEEITKLRREFHKADVNYIVVKNTLARRSCEQADLKEVLPYLDGPNAMAIAKGDPVAPVRIIVDFIKDHEKKGKPAIKGAVIEGQLLSAEEAEKMKDIPPREVLLGQIVSGISSPLTGFIGGLQSMMRQLVSALDAIKKQKES